MRYLQPCFDFHLILVWFHSLSSKPINSNMKRGLYGIVLSPPLVLYSCCLPLFLVFTYGVHPIFPDDNCSNEETVRSIYLIDLVGPERTKEQVLMAFVSNMVVILIRDLLHLIMSSVYWYSLGGNSQIFPLFFNAPTTLSIDATNDEESYGPTENKKGTSFWRKCCLWNSCWSKQKRLTPTLRQFLLSLKRMNQRGLMLS